MQNRQGDLSSCSQIEEHFIWQGGTATKGKKGLWSFWFRQNIGHETFVLVCHLINWSSSDVMKSHNSTPRFIIVGLPQQQQQLWLRWSKGCVKFMIKLRDGSIICSLLCIFFRRGSRWMVGMVLLVLLQPRVFPAAKTNLHSSRAGQRWSILWRHRSPEPQLLPWLLPR